MSTFPVDNRTAAQPQVSGSKLAPKNGYGQNGFQGASSDLPGQHTTSGFLPQVKAPSDPWQTRKVSTDPYPTSYGMKDRRATVETIPAKTNRRG